MEIGIVLAVAALGHALASGGKASRFEPTTPTTLPNPTDGLPASMRAAGAYPWGPDTETGELQAAERERMIARWNESRDPAFTGVIAPDTRPDHLPYFRSERTRFSSDLEKQTKVELFTGALDVASSATGTNARKQETGALFAPELSRARVTSGGAARNVAYDPDVRDRFVVSGIQNNVVPTEQIRVGPGVGYDPSIPAAGGFHNTFRILPPNVNAYRLNSELPAVVAHGASRVSNRPADVELAQHTAPRFWTIKQRPLERTRAAITAATTRPIVSRELRCGNAKMGEGGPYFGGGARAGAQINERTLTRPGKQRVPTTTAALNLTQSRDGIGGYAGARFDPQRLEAQKREASTPVGVARGPVAPPGQSTFVTAATHRSQTIGAEGYVGIAGLGRGQEAGAARPTTGAGATLRQQLHERGAGLVGIVAGEHHAPSAPLLDDLRYASRYDATVGEWVPAPNARRNDVHLPSEVRITGRVGPEGYVPVAGSVISAPTLAHGAVRVPSGRVLTPSLHAQDLSLAATLNSTNDFATSITR